jgi:hypothetical protein
LRVGGVHPHLPGDQQDVAPPRPCAGTASLAAAARQESSSKVPQEAAPIRVAIMVFDQL